MGQIYIQARVYSQSLYGIAVKAVVILLLRIKI